MLLKNRFFKIACYVIFWTIASIIFIRYSYIRPGCYTEPYKEVLCVIMIAMIIFLNKFILFPKLYLEGDYLKYWFINFFLFFFIGFIEILMVKSNIYEAVGKVISAKEYSWYIIDVYLLVTFRYTAIFAFFYARRVNQKIKFLSLRQQKLLALENKQIFLDPVSGKEKLLTIDDITYISVDGNYSIVHLINKQEYKQVQSLVDFEDILPENTGLRINRNTYVMYNYVCEYTEHDVTVRINEIGDKKSFSFFHNKKKLIFDTLKTHVTPEIKKMNCERKKDEKITKLQTKNDENCELNEIHQHILEIIQTKPNIFASEIKKKLPHSCERTIDNYLRQLKDIGLIEYKGSSKTGGYYLV